jgi:hypothetical protein
LEKEMMEGQRNRERYAFILTSKPFKSSIFEGIPRLVLTKSVLGLDGSHLEQLMSPAAKWPQ